jgi:hypothetical protein
LPNPFYRLGGGVLHTDVLARSARNVLRLGGVFLILLVFGLLRKESRRLALAVIVPVVLFTALWVFLSDETNYYMRYRYPILPMILIGAAEVGGAVLAPAPAAAPLRRMPRTLVSLAAVAFIAILIVVQHRQLRHIEPRRMGLFDVARRLHPYRGKGYTLATTEAGLLPLYSQWRSVDAWGLNDPWIAQHGLVKAEYLDLYRPELVMFHAYFSPQSPRDEPASRRGLGRAWDDTVRTLQSYAEGRGYELAAVFARGPHESHYYYVRPGFLDHDAIVAAVRVGDYEWDGQPASDLTPAAAR